MRDLDVIVEYIQNQELIASTLESIDFENYSVHYSNGCVAYFERKEITRSDGDVRTAAPLEFKKVACNASDIKPEDKTQEALASWGVVKDTTSLDELNIFIKTYCTSADAKRFVCRLANKRIAQLKPVTVVIIPTTPTTPTTQEEDAYIVVRTAHTGDRVYIDGKYVGPSSQKAHKVKPGKHKIKITKKGRVDKVIDVDVKPGERLRSPVMGYHKLLKLKKSACTKGNCENGKGTYEYSDGKICEGNRRNGELNGRGWCRWTNGDKYAGQFRNGNRNGKGTYTYASGNKYVGQWWNGYKHGLGTKTYAKGDKYVGQYINGKKNGQGTYTYASGNKYVGQWRNDKLHGQGTYTYANRNKYVGQWRDDKKHGQGAFTWAGGRKFIGQFKNGKFWLGDYYDPNGTKDPGKWGKRNGEWLRVD